MALVSMALSNVVAPLSMSKFISARWRPTTAIQRGRSPRRNESPSRHGRKLPHRPVF